MCGTRGNPFIFSPCQGCSVPTQCSGPSPIPDLHRWTLENLLYLFANDSTICHDIPNGSSFRQEGCSLFPFFRLTKSQDGQTLGIHLSILTNPHSHHLSPKRPSGNPTTSSIYFINNPLEEVQSFKFLGFTISHDLSWANHISKLASKIGILHRTKVSSTGMENKS